MDKLESVFACNKRKESLIKRFWSKVDVKSDIECWEWKAKAQTSLGYGLINAGRKNGLFKAHRVAYFICKGFIPNGMWVLHSCDNPKCCNPNHLRAGTPKENTMDCILRNRKTNPPIKYGEKHHNAKLTSQDLNEIVLDKRTYRELSIQYKVSHQTIYRIKKRKTRKNEIEPIGDKTNARL
jgi:hypothetical protein